MGPEAQAVGGALTLNTMVVAPGGNDGVAGPGFGSVAGPAAAPGALAVAATDTRTELPQARVVLRRGLDVIFDREVPVLGATGSSRSLDVRPRAGRCARARRRVRPQGVLRVAGRVIVAPAGNNPETQAATAARAGAAALVLYGDALPAGSLRVGAQQTVPVVVVPTAAASSSRGATRRPRRRRGDRARP